MTDIDLQAMMRHVDQDALRQQLADKAWELAYDGWTCIGDYVVTRTYDPPDVRDVDLDDALDPPRGLLDLMDEADRDGCVIRIWHGDRQLLALVPEGYEP